MFFYFSTNQTVQNLIEQNLNASKLDILTLKGLHFVVVFSRANKGMNFKQSETQQIYLYGQAVILELKGREHVVKYLSPVCFSPILYIKNL